MKRHILHYLLCFFILLPAVSCDSGNDGPDIPGGGGDEQGFYASPFSGVPETTDIMMYQVNPRVFAPGNSLKAVTGKLEDIKALSVNVIWLMPIYELGIEKAKSSPYCIRDYKKLDPEFGTLEDLRELVAKAHSLGMAVIMDWVANHTSWDHPWITSHKDWYSQDSNGNIVTPNSSWLDVAQLNFENATMRKEMISAMKYWIYEANIDGYRCDAADRMPVTFWRDAIREMRNMQAGRDIMMLAEGTRLENFPAGFDIDYAWDFMKVLKKVYGSGETTVSLVTSHEAEYKNLSAGKRKLRFITNHDEAVDAPPSALYGGRDGAVSAFVATASLGGNPMIYSSQEVGYDKRISFFKYVEIDWSDNPDLLTEYKSIMKAFAANTALRKGTLQSFSRKDVLGIYKLYERNEVVVLANTRNNQRTIQLDKNYLSGNWKNAITGEEVTLTGQMELQPYQYLILTK